MLLQGGNHHNQYCTNEQKVTGVIGSLIVFSIFTYHSRNNFTRPHGERYVFIVRWGRRDHPWEGQSEYVMSGSPPLPISSGRLAPKAIGNCFTFRRPIGHPYYTQHTLRHLADQYPGWDTSGEYQAAIAEVDVQN